VSSFSFAQRIASNSDFENPLTVDVPVGQGSAQPDWNAYRLSKARMRHINVNSDHMLFTCGFENVDYVNQTDHLQVPLQQFAPNNDFTTTSPNDVASFTRGQVQGINLNECETKLHQDGKCMHVHITHKNNCEFLPASKPSGCSKFDYFGEHNGMNCIVPTHRCTKDVNSTTQFWFG
jgi:hypothetical protein